MKTVISIAFILMSCTYQQPMEVPDNMVIAHRGMPYFAPEETAPSYILAAQLGVDYLEADLQRTRDGIIICLHDNNLRRTTDIEQIYPERADEPVSSFTLEELMILDAGAWFNLKYPDRRRAGFEGMHILTLDQLLDVAENSKYFPGIYLETKRPDLFPGIERDLFYQLNEREWVGARFDDGRPRLILQTFSLESLKLLHENFFNTPLCYLLWEGEGCLATFDKNHVQACFNEAKQAGATIIGPSFNGQLNNYSNIMEPWFVEMTKAQGFQLHPYTFDTMEDFEHFAPLSSGQFTNRADLLLEYYGRHHVDVQKLLMPLE